MFGVLLQLISSFFEECANTLGKDNIRKHVESALAMGFVNALVTSGIFVLTITVMGRWGTLTLLAWPTFLIRVVLNIIQSASTVIALGKAERSTFGFLRVGTMPLLLLIDVATGVMLTGWQVIGMLCIALTILLLMMNHGLSKKGIGFVLYSTVSSAFQLSLYRFDITHGNSVELEQLLVSAVVAVALYLMVIHNGGHPFRLFKRGRPMLQSGFVGAANLVGGYAYLYAPASIILSTGRAAGVMASVLAGHLYFREKKFSLKLLAFIGCAIGIILLTVGTM